MDLSSKIVYTSIGLGLSAAFLAGAAVVTKRILETGGVYPFQSLIITKDDVNGNGSDKSERYVEIGGERFYSVIDGKRAEDYMEKRDEEEK